MIDEAMIRSCGPMVTALCRRMLRDSHLAEDTEQNVWEKILRTAESFRGESRFSTWVYAVARNEILKVLKDEKRRDYQTLIGEYHAGDFRPSDSASLRDQAAGFCNACLTGVLAVLDPEDRLIYLFRDVVGLPYAEIARIMEQEEPSVRQRTSRAARRLRKFLTEECALLVPGSLCRCGMARYMGDAGLQQEFHRLRRVAARASVYRESETVFPKAGYWLKLLKN